MTNMRLKSRVKGDNNKPQRIPKTSRFYKEGYRWMVAIDPPGFIEVYKTKAEAEGM